ncbi:MAG: hypothetical protein ABEH78_10165 [Haloferacaceae archaeon]
MIVHPCPLCGEAVNSRGEPFDEPYKTRAHIDGAHDEDHAGERGEAYMDQIRENTRQMDGRERQTVERGGGYGPSGSEVEVSLGVGETMKMPVERAVKLNATRIADPEGFGIASQGTAWEIRQENKKLRDELDELRDRVATLESEVAVLSAESETLEGECTDCGGRLTLDSGGSGEAAVVCEECDERRVEL